MPTTRDKRPADKWTSRTVAVDVDFNDAEEALLMARAAQKGLTLEEYIRTVVGLEP